ncbi:TetR/AcrR family transcriptional regulator [Streptomyces sp. NPDC004609]|uniref:TetR/AcrR family transcriptional regulator n=1 Tax=Streptomyces sp. NPDC004609 TaxID=3364704 RepID=UPI00368A52D0
MRRDAELNRRRLIAAAREVFRDRGLGATLDEIARHAGVGVGTAYRHFPNKQAVIDAVFKDMFIRIEEATREGAADPDAWRGLTTGLERIAELQALDRGLREVLFHTDRTASVELRAREQLRQHLDLTVERAKRQGTLRADAEPWDMLMIQQMLAAVTDATTQPGLWRRYLRLFLDGLRTRPEGTEPLPCADFGAYMASPGPGGSTHRGPSQREAPAGGPERRLRGEGSDTAEQ